MDTFLHPMLTEETTLPFYVKCVGGFKNQAPILRIQGFPDHQWIHCLKGTGKLIIENKEYVINTNTGMFIPAHIPHEYYATEEPWETHFVAFSGYGIPELLNSLELKKFEIFILEDIRYIDSILGDIFITSKSNTIAAAYKSSSLLYTLLIEIRNNIRNNSNNIENIQLKKLQPIIDFLEENYSREISIEEMSIIISSSPQYLCRLFNKNLKIRPFAYLNKLRIQKAKEFLIKSKEESIGDICARVGFHDQSYFCSTFKKYEGFTPSEYRNIFS
jgi:AraC family transcriptional regulator of arabinose operon